MKTKSEVEYDELIEEILIRMKVNDLYVKPEKFKWKVREIGFS